MRLDRNIKPIALVLGAVIILIGAGGAFGARPPAINGTAVSKTSDVLEIERAANGRLLAIGRIDRIWAPDFTISLLGQNFVLVGGAANLRFVNRARVGRPVALFGEYYSGNYFVDAAIVLDGQYVQGASKVYLRGPVKSVNRKIGAISVGSLELDVSAISHRSSASRLTSGSAAAIMGTQPSVEGKVLVERLRLDASVGTGRTNAAIGTGRPEASVGTGRPEASVGTGKPNASVGTGRPDASVGTGRPDASVGTGRPDASVGTGRTNAAVGTGRPEASVGTGRPEASVGTGKPNASVGTGNSAG